ELPLLHPASRVSSVPDWPRWLSRLPSAGPGTLEKANYGPGIGLFSRRVTPRVSSALGRFTAVFGMGTGGATPPKTPGPGLNREHMWRSGPPSTAQSLYMIGLDPVGAARRAAWRLSPRPLVPLS